MHKNLSQSPRILVGDPRLTIARSTEGWWAKLVNAGHAFSRSSLTQCTLLIPFWNKYPFPIFSRSNLTLCLLLMSCRKKCPAPKLYVMGECNSTTLHKIHIGLPNMRQASFILIGRPQWWLKVLILIVQIWLIVADTSVWLMVLVVGLESHR